MYGAPGASQRLNTLPRAYGNLLWTQYLSCTMNYFALQLLTLWKPTRSNLSKLGFYWNIPTTVNIIAMGESCARKLFKLSPHNSFNCCAFLCTRFILIPCERVIQMLCEIFSLCVIYRVWIICYKFTCVSRVCSFTHTSLIIRFWFDHIEITQRKNLCGQDFVSSVASGAPQTCDIFTEH